MYDDGIETRRAGNSTELIEIKTKLMNILADSPELVDLLVVNPEDRKNLLWNLIYPIGMVVPTLDESKCYITISANTDGTSIRSNMFVTTFIDIAVICSVPNIQTDIGNSRCDEICIIIDKLINGKDISGIGTVKKIKSEEGSISRTHYIRSMIYKTSDLAEPVCE